MLSIDKRKLTAFNVRSKKKKKRGGHIFVLSCPCTCIPYGNAQRIDLLHVAYSSTLFVCPDIVCVCVYTGVAWNQHPVGFNFRSISGKEAFLYTYIFRKRRKKKKDKIFSWKQVDRREIKRNNKKPDCYKCLRCVFFQEKRRSCVQYKAHLFKSFIEKKKKEERIASTFFFFGRKGNSDQRLFLILEISAGHTEYIVKTTFFSQER